jgi:hypothetical protein
MYTLIGSIMAAVSLLMSRVLCDGLHEGLHGESASIKISAERDTEHKRALVVSIRQNYSGALLSAVLHVPFAVFMYAYQWSV